MTDHASPSRLPTIDGLRGLAVIAVLLYHAGALSGDALKAPGGFLGVSVFFVVSGFVITRLIVDEHERSHTVAIGHFVGRRVARLAPVALVTVLLVVLLSRTPIANWDVPQSFRASDALSAAWNFSNWHLAMLPDAAGFRLAHPLAHFWSLGVETQLYSLFAVTVFVCRKGNLRQRLLVTAGVAWAGSLGMALVVHGGLRREEFGTDIRLAEFAAGVALAAALPRLTPFLRRHQFALGGGGAAAMLFFVIAVAVVDRRDEWLDHGGYALLSLVWALWVASAALSPGESSVLSWPTLVHIGVISYSLYVVHWPISLLLTDHRLQSHGAVAAGLRIAASLLAAEILHHGLERPARRRLAAKPLPLLLGIWAVALALVSGAALALL